ncbi:hypothetical protein GH733_016370, partial [Mirounga leonina]
MTFGIWTALLYIYIHHNHVSNLEKKPQGPALIWSLGKKFQQQITHDDKLIPRSRVRFERPDEDETAEYQTFLKSGKCLQKHYPANLPTASVVICFHNEEFNALFRTMSSVINLTPQHILEEIILVDDMSNFDDLKEKLDHRLEIFRGKIKLIRNKKKEGLIRSRLIGASRAS